MDPFDICVCMSVIMIVCVRVWERLGSVYIPVVAKINSCKTWCYEVARFDFLLSCD